MSDMSNEEFLREQFESELPEALKEAKQELRDRFEQNELPELLRKHEEQMRDQFESDLEDQLKALEDEQADIEAEAASAG